MSSSLLPPLPALIPISVLRKSPPSNNNSGAGDRAHRDCAPCANRSKIMGEQRSRRPGRQPSIDLIDNVRSRGTSAAPQARKIRPERHRKSDRRRDHRRRVKTKFETEKDQKDDSNHSSERPLNPRVNPIFVWVRQEDTRIVEVKCEDYDKRNRILLTKTPQGWRATPRTETLAPSLKEEVDKKHHHHHHRSKKSKRHKTKQKSTSVQVNDLSDDNHEETVEGDSQAELQDSYPSWESPVNVESLLPSHTIHVAKRISPCREQSPSNNSNSVNSGVNDSAQTQSKCSADKICDISPLDNLLAVAELEFNQQIQSGEWNECNPNESTQTQILDIEPKTDEEIIEDQKSFIEDMEHLKILIESCTQDQEGKLETEEDFIDTSLKEDCDYTEDDENNLAMDDILSRLEQSLRSPDSPDITLSFHENGEIDERKLDDIKLDGSADDLNEKVPECSNASEIDEPIVVNSSDTSNGIETSCENFVDTVAQENPNNEDSKVLEQPTDLSIRSKKDLSIEIPAKNDEPEQPTDLSIPKINKLSPLIPLMPRPPSQSSEALQSPQPSGIPAVPPSPDIVSPGANNSRSRSNFLETLLSSTSPKMALNSEVTIERQKEPLDLGKCRKSASPTVTCSEEFKGDLFDCEPPSKKMKPIESITLKNLLDNATEAKKNEKTELPVETPKLLELLNTENDNPPVSQLNKILSDKALNIPDPMLVPKENLSKIIANPAKEIPELLKGRPELRLPEALAYPHLLQDPDILVITLQQLETIVRKQSQVNIEKPATSKRDMNLDVSERDRQTTKKADSPKVRSSSKYDDSAKISHSIREFEKKAEKDLSELDFASNAAAFNQMLWLPYMNQMEAMQFGGNSDFSKILGNVNMPTSFSPQISDLSHLLMNNRFPSIPTNIPMHGMSYSNPLEMQMWQEAMIQANMLETKSNSNGADMRNSFKEFMEKMNYSAINKNYMHNQKHQMQSKQNMPNQFFQNFPGVSNPYMNVSQMHQSNMKANLPMPSQFGAMYSQKHITDHRNSSKYQSKMEHKMNLVNSYQQQLNQEKHSNYGRNAEHQGAIRTKPAYKLMNNVAPYQKTSTHEHHHHSKEKTSDGHPKQHISQPMDLSGATTTTGGRLKVKQHQQLIDPLHHRKLLRQEDVAEVGSTTASIEEMQEAHKHLWHPLFGNEKGYNTSWSWTPSVTASAE